jgi:hypothetical protein
MPLEKLSRTEMIALKGGGPSPVIVEYAAFLGGLSIGEGGRATVARENATRFTVKKRIQAAADAVGVTIAFHRAPPETLVFEVVEAGTAPKRRGRPPKQAS